MLTPPGKIHSKNSLTIALEFLMSNKKNLEPILEIKQGPHFYLWVMTMLTDENCFMYIKIQHTFLYCIHMSNIK